MTSIAPGMFLVASSSLDGDDCFGRSVILLVDVSEQGILGLNMAGPARDYWWNHVGGPMESPFWLLSKADAKTQSQALGDSGYCAECLYEATTAAEAVPLVASQLLMHQKTSMVMSGYAGWSPPQLEREVGLGFWRVASLSIDRLLSVAAEQRWAQANWALIEAAHAAAGAAA